MAQAEKDEAYRERKRATFKRWYYGNYEANRKKNKEYRGRTGYKEHQREYLLEKKAIALAYYGYINRSGCSAPIKSSTSRITRWS